MAQALKRSSVFLAFSDLEGLPLPPLEAALTGNFVVGYHGEGGREYWHDGVFVGIEKGNLHSFVHETLELIHRIDTEGLRPRASVIDDLHHYFSRSAQTESAKRIVEHTISSIRSPMASAGEPTPDPVDLAMILAPPKSLRERLRTAKRGIRRASSAFAGIVRGGVPKR